MNRILRRNFVLLFTLGLIVLPLASAQAGLLEFLFPTLRNSGPDPSQTLQAPFANPPAASEAEQGAPAVIALPENDIPIDKPHRSSQAVGEWAMTVVNESMTFISDAPAQELQASKKNFKTEGRQQYEAFLQQNNIIKVLQSGTFYIRSFADNAPLLRTEGVAGGAYKWVFDVPLTVSYMKRNEKDYRKATPINQDMTITVQVGRSKEAGNEEGVLIERWSGKVKSANKK